MRNYEKISIFIFMLLFNLITFAQPGDDNADGDLEGPDAVPLNNKIILLAIVGIVFVFYKLKASTKTTELN